MRSWGSYLGEEDIYDREEAYQSSLLLDAIDDDSDDDEIPIDDGRINSYVLKGQMNPISLYQIATATCDNECCVAQIESNDTEHPIHKMDETLSRKEVINSCVEVRTTMNMYRDIMEKNDNVILDVNVAKEGSETLKRISIDFDTIELNDSELELTSVPSLAMQQSITELTGDIFADIELDNDSGSVTNDNSNNLSLDPLLIAEIDKIISTYHNSNYGQSTRSHSNNNRNNSNSQKQTNNYNNHSNHSSNNGNNHGAGIGGSGGDKDKNDEDDNKDKKRKNNESKNDQNDEEDEEDEEDTKEEEKEKQLDINAPEFIPNMNGKQSINKLLPIDEKRPLSAYKTKKPSKQSKKQSNKSNYSYNPNPEFRARGNIKILRSFTNKNGKIANMIKEDIKNLYFYIDKSCAIQNSKEIRTKHGKIIKIMDCDFHQKETNEKLYCILKKCDNINTTLSEWEMSDELLTATEIQKKYKITADKIPLSARMTEKYQQQLNQKEQIKNILMNKHKMNAIINKTKWTKIPIKNRYHSKKRITLSLTREEFIKNLNNLNVYNNKNDIHLMPIVMFNNFSNNKYWIEYLWITQIDDDTNIAISLIYNDKKDSLSIKGIHLDKTYILHQTQLASPLYFADCLDNIFISNITDLLIGNPDDQKNAINALKQRNETLKQQKDDLNIKFDNLNEDNINLKKDMEKIKHEYEKMKQFMLCTYTSSTPVTPITPSTTTPTSIADIIIPNTPNSVPSSPLSQTHKPIQHTSFVNNNSNVLCNLPGFYSIGQNFILLKHQ